MQEISANVEGSSRQELGASSQSMRMCAGLLLSTQQLCKALAAASTVAVQ
jgi:hypothetical protein